MNLSDAIKIYIGENEVSGVHQGGDPIWASGVDSFLYGTILTQIDDGVISSQSMGIGVPSAPIVLASISLISETPVSKNTDLSIPSAPIVLASTSVISETPVSKNTDLPIPAVPSVSVNTLVETV